MLRYALIAIGIYFLARFILELVIPVYRTTRQVRKQFRDMKERMESMQEGQTGPMPQRPRPEPQNKSSKDDYLDFEEVK
jgi:hypothetical protein